MYSDLIGLLVAILTSIILGTGLAIILYKKEKNIDDVVSSLPIRSLSLTLALTMIIILWAGWNNFSTYEEIVHNVTSEDDAHGHHDLGNPEAARIKEKSHTALLTLANNNYKSLYLVIITSIILVITWFFSFRGLNRWKEELLKARNESTQHKTFLKTLLDHIPLTIFAKDVKDDYRFALLNKAAQEIFCLKESDALGKNDYDFFPKTQADFFRNTDESVMSGKKLIDIEAEFVTTPKGTFVAHTLKVPIYNEKGEPSVLLGILEDVTSKIRAQEELHAAKEEAEQANQAKSEFLANMSHEIRTPMNGIIGLTRLLAETKLDEEQKQSLDAVLKSSESLLLLLNDILDFSKIEAGEFHLEETPFNIKSSLKNVINLLSPIASRKGLVLELNYDDALPTGIIGDPLRINQIITNLVGNAVKFTEKGKVSVIVSGTPTANDSKYNFKFIIKDTGIGIPVEVQGTLFKKFSQGDASTTRKFGGTGLGLAIAKSLTELMKGAISFESVPNVGTTFTVSIPLTISANQIVDSIQDQSKTYTGTADFSPYHLLVVDDHPINMLFAGKLLKKLGFVHIDEATTGSAALEKVSGGKRYDIILMDCQMPGMDGFEATRHIRDLEKKTGSHVPIVAMTANAMEGDRDLCIRAGMDDYLSKPVNPDKLYGILSRWLVDNGTFENKSSVIQTAGNDDETIIDLAHLELFTDGDLEQEKMISDIFFEVSEETIEILKNCIKGKKSDGDWKAAAHKLKGSSAQIGAKHLSALSMEAEKNPDYSFERKTILLKEIEKSFEEVRKFFKERQISA